MANTDIPLTDSMDDVAFDGFFADKNSSGSEMISTVGTFSRRDLNCSSKLW